MQAHCTSPGTTTHAAAPKNDIMLFVAVLPLGEPENLCVSDASSRFGFWPGVKLPYDPGLIGHVLQPR